jgi:hypothetical protein
MHSNELTSSFEQSNDKVYLVADKSSHIKEVADITGICFPTLDLKLNVFIVQFKQLPDFTDNA